ncbi:hypothetical protein ACLOJK_002417 [Asimina triloba]
MKTRRRIPTAFISVFIAAFLVLFSYHYLFHVLFPLHLRPLSPSSFLHNTHTPSLAIHEHATSLHGHGSPYPDSILFHDWEVLLVLPHNHASSSIAGGRSYKCLFQDGSTSRASPSVVLQSGTRPTFKCRMPFNVRRLRPFFTPSLTLSPAASSSAPSGPAAPQEMFRWNFLVYDSVSTADDVIVFAKGINSRQGTNMPPAALRCVFGDGVRTTVTGSAQEVFRCEHPALPFPSGEKVKVSLEMGGEGFSDRLLPSVALYDPPRRTPAPGAKPALICACTMVYNAAKFLREWVMYHTSIGVERFVLYDNDSDDNIAEVVAKLLEAGYDVTTHVWPWPKTQEAGFSHCAVAHNDTCTWMMFMDVDEFFFSRSWANASQPSKDMLRSLLTTTTTTTPSSPSSSPYSPPSPTPSTIGQISMRCYEFGPSNQRSHPKSGVTQGYTCRRRIEERHKSMVMLDAIDPSLLNVIHHFELRGGYRARALSSYQGVVNHYKYQAWPEFKKKFRRRVSAYVVDWRDAVNPASKDRTPGLGFAAVEPEGWKQKFCEVNDSQLRDLNRRWFGLTSPIGSSRMVWED